MVTTEELYEQYLKIGGTLTFEKWFVVHDIDNMQHVMRDFSLSPKPEQLEGELQKGIKIDCPASLKSEISDFGLNIL
jgi:hypothetical protein